MLLRVLMNDRLYLLLLLARQIQIAKAMRPARLHDLFGRIDARFPGVRGGLSGRLGVLRSLLRRSLLRERAQRRRQYHSKTRAHDEFRELHKAIVAPVVKQRMSPRLKSRGAMA